MKYPIRYMQLENTNESVEIYSMFAADEHLDFAIEHKFGIIITDTNSSRMIEFLNKCYKCGYKSINFIEVPQTAPDGLILSPRIYVHCTKSKLSPNNLHRMDFVTRIAGSDNNPIEGTERNHTLLFNCTQISDDEVIELIDSGMYEYSDKVVELSSTQLSNLSDKN